MDYDNLSTLLKMFMETHKDRGRVGEKENGKRCKEKG